MTTILLVAACSNTKNTPVTRRVQAFKARYNTYYNGTLAFIDGRQAQEQGNKDNCTELIPLYMTGNKGTVKMGGSNYSTAIEKCQKTIKQHSITVKPKWNKNRPKTLKEKLWLSQKEYNPFLHKAWFMMGESQFRRGEYLEAASTFAYIQLLYATKPNIVARARMLEAKCYAEMEWFYDAEDIVSRAQRDSFPTNLNYLKAQVNADLDIRQKRYESAIGNLKIAAKKEKRSLQKARMYFLLGQLCHKVGSETEAYKYYTRVIRKNPPYELEFNARIARTETMPKGKNKQMIRSLKAMARNPKNKDYLDQVYYAIGNIYLSDGDTLHAIWAYNDGVEKATRRGIEKGVLLVHLGQLYWDTEKFVKAQKCYGEALGLFDKDHEDYKAIDDRAKILEELLPHASAVELQDSLQALAAMDSVQRMEVIKKIIEELKKKEKEEERKAQEAAQQANNPRQNMANQNNQRAGGINRMNQDEGGVFYFYTPATVEAGKRAFEQKWGKRKNADDWRRNNKTVLNDFNDEMSIDSLLTDSLQMDSLQMDSLKAAQKGNVKPPADDDKKDKKKLTKEEKDSIQAAEYANDPHRPEYYLKDIPFTEEQMEASNAALVEGLFGSAVIFKDRMENLPLAERTFQRIRTDFPDYEKNNEMYYNMFQMYSRMEMKDSADVYRNKLIEEFPEDEHAILIADPNFEFKARYGKQVEDSIYTVTYDAFQVSDYETVLKNNEYTATEYPKGENRPRFMFFDAMSHLEMGEQQGFMSSMKEIVEKYPKSTVSELAGLYVKGLKEGRLLASGKFNSGSIWERRRLLGEEEDSLGNDTTFSTEKNCDFVFCVAYERDSVNENQLLFEMARYNFTNFTVRNFDITFDRGQGIDMLQVRTFLNYDEAYIYLHRLMNNADMAYKLQGLKCFIIAEDNLKKLMKGLSFADYFDFYDENFDRIGSLQIKEDEPSSLDEPTELPEPQEEEEEEELEDDFIF
ncbi:MAG: tetratricopeptide repeat protein [Bacteroidaceae bacterium]|nr:tetratricopeptide repeat protein [Bacteroidaceae bacterium]